MTTLIRFVPAPEHARMRFTKTNNHINTNSIKGTNFFTVKDLLHSIEINYFGGDNSIIATFTINTKY